MKQINLLKLIINSIFLSFVLLPLFSVDALAADEYVCEVRPVLNQPWYFDNPSAVAIDPQGNVYIADSGNNRIQKFSSSVEFITKWGSWGDGDGQFSYPEGIAIDPQGNVFVVDTWNYRIQKFNSSGDFITKWGSEGYSDGQFLWPTGIAIDPQANVYVVDSYYRRIQKFSSSGEFVSKWVSVGDGDGQFSYPEGIAIDPHGYVYIADTLNDRVQKFSSSGDFICKWESWGAENAQFRLPAGIAIDSQGSIYVADTYNSRIQKFSSSGDFITKWGSWGEDDGQFHHPRGIAIDPHGHVYTTDDSHQVRKFHSSGEFISKWGSSGDGDGQFCLPEGIAIDPRGYVYIADTLNDRVQKFNSSGQFVVTFCRTGSDPGLVHQPRGLAVGGDDKICVADSGNNRIQIFTEATIDFNNKAIIVAGSGPYVTNTLWDATQICANYAHRALTHQGYTKDTIYYLSADMDLDLDNDGYPDVDGDATNANLEYAIKTWAADADNVFIYLVGHGGESTFRMSEFELLDASVLDAWLDTSNQNVSDFVALVYDGCESGSFVSSLLPPPGKTRIVATSTSLNEPAIFEVDGSLSFGHQFFAELFNGSSFYDSFVIAKKCVEATYGEKQNPQLEGNANGVGNEKADQEIANAIRIGNETKTAADIPSIQEVSAPQTLTAGETFAFIHAQNVVDANGIQEVFAVIKPPNHSSGSPDTPVTDLPTITLISVGNNNYSGSYDGFSSQGDYHVTIFARDRKGVLSLPYLTSVTVPTDTDCLSVGAGLGIQVLCAEYNGNPYGFMLDFYHHPDDPSGYYWKLVIGTLTTGTGSYCIAIGSNLSMPMDCISYNGTQYGLTLDFYPNPYDPSGLYWVMDKSTLSVK